MNLIETIRSKRLAYVGTRGTPGDGVVIVGEAPGADEERLSLPFVGVSGRELGRMLRDADWKGTVLNIETGTRLYAPNDIWYTNVFKVRPPENKLPRLAEFGIPLELFINDFIAEIRRYKPTIIIATGNTSLGTLCPETRGKDASARIGTFRGSLLTSSLLDWSHYVIPCHHPAFVLRQWEERPVCVLCLERARTEWEYFRANGRLQPLPERVCRIQPDFSALYAYLIRCLYPIRKRVSIDIETPGGWPTIVAVALSPWDVTSFSFWDYTDDQLVIIWKLFNQILKECPQIGQNYISFDCSYFEWLGLEPDLRLFESNTEDTMLLHHVLWPELPHKLEFLTMQYTRQPYYKDEGKRWKSRDGLPKLMAYNALDAAVTYEVWIEMQKELEERVCQNGNTISAKTAGLQNSNETICQSD